MSVFSVEVVQDAAQCVITVAGEVDVEFAGELASAGVRGVESADPGCTAVVVDLTAVGFLDSSGLAALVAIANAAEVRGLRVQLRGVHEQTAKILRITGLDDTFDLV